MVFTLERERFEADVHVRMFAPLLGVPEDPATRSANGGLRAYLVHHEAVPIIEPTAHIVSEQGEEMSQPSTLYVEVDHTDGKPTADSLNLPLDNDAKPQPKSAFVSKAGQ